MSDSKAHLTDSKAHLTDPHEDSAAPVPPPDYVWRLAAPPAQPPAIARSNSVHINRAHAQVSGTFVIDPALSVPAALLAGAVGDERPNLRLESQYAHVAADVWVLPVAADADSEKPRTTLEFDAQHGRLDIRLHSLGSRPCTIALNAGYAHANLTLPRDLSAAAGVSVRLSTHTTHGSTVISPRFARLGETEGVEKYYLGVTQNDEDAHSISVTAPHGKITVCFEGDIIERAKPQGWFS